MTALTAWSWNTTTRSQRRHSSTSSVDSSRIATPLAASVDKHLVKLPFRAQVDAAHRIVQDQHARLGRDESPEQRLLLISAAQRGDRRLEVRHLHLHLATDLGQRAACGAPHRSTPQRARSCQRRYGHVVEDRERRENAFGLAIARQKSELRARGVALRTDRPHLARATTRLRRDGGRPRRIRETPPARGPSRPPTPTISPAWRSKSKAGRPLRHRQAAHRDQGFDPRAAAWYAARAAARRERAPGVDINSSSVSLENKPRSSVATLRPERSTVARSARLPISSIRWETKRIDRPFAAKISAAPRKVGRDPRCRSRTSTRQE